MPETEYFSVRASADLVAEATRVAVAKSGRPAVDRGQLIRAALYAVALGCVSDEDLEQCLERAELRRGWPRRGEQQGRWITRANGPDYRARDE